jgi:uncharacterized protein YbjT (DUF2867 family)
MSRTILVAGANGGVGSQVVRQLLERGEQIRLLVRDAERAVQMFGPQPEVMVVDTRVLGSLRNAIKDIDYLICATGSRAPGTDNSPEQVDYHGVANLAQSASETGVKHFVLVSSIAVTKTDHPLNRFGRVLEWKLKGENALRASGLPYTIIRPGGLTDGPGGIKRLLIKQGDQITGMISRADVARLCIAALDELAARNVTFEVVETEGEPLKNTGEYFAGLSPD